MLELSELHPRPRFLPPEHIHGHPEIELTTDEIIEITRAKIEAIVKRSKSPTRIDLTMLGGEEQRLVSIYDTNMVYLRAKESEEVVGHTSANIAQELIVKLLYEYGLNPDVNYLTDRLTGLKEGGLDVESLRFPSQTTPGLAFTRVRIFDKLTSNIDSIHWYANDIASPLRIRNRDFLPPRK